MFKFILDAACFQIYCACPWVEKPVVQASTTTSRLLRRWAHPIPSPYTSYVEKWTNAWHDSELNTPASKWLANPFWCLHGSVLAPWFWGVDHLGTRTKITQYCKIWPERQCHNTEVSDLYSTMEEVWPDNWSFLLIEKNSFCKFIYFIISCFYNHDIH